MRILFCAECGIRVPLEEMPEGTVRCEDCTAGRPRRHRSGRSGDSAILTRSTTSRVLKRIEMNSVQEKQ